MVLDDRWRKATRSGPTGQCVQVRRLGDVVETRDSKAGPDSLATQTYTLGEWAAFIDSVKDGEFDL